MRALIVFSLFFALVYSACPWSNTTLTNWSTVPAFNKYNATIVIAAGSRYLLDVSPPTLWSITINGDLVIANSNINLTTNWIKVNSGGRFIAGSEEKSCQITSKFTVTFNGPRTTVSDMGTDPVDGGSKGMAVATGGTLELHGATYGASWTRLAATASIGTNVLILEEAVTWPVGSKIVLATTDFSEIWDKRKIPAGSLNYIRGLPAPDQSEVLTVVSVTGNTVTVKENLLYTHWGTGVEKAEVGLLTRKIVFQGDEDSNSTLFGGHLIMRPATLHISGVEFTRFGQKGLMGRYPVHFHLVANAVGKGYYARDNSIHDNYQRCLVIHASDGIDVSNNVAYNTNGHCYFLEDACEQSNSFIHNLGITVHPVAAEDAYQLIPTDSEPTVFWITNVNNTFVNNSAVSGKFGYWFSLPDKTIGLSAAKYANDPWIRPRCMPIRQFDYNVAHSNVETGFLFDFFVNPDGTVAQLGTYLAAIGPFNPALPCESSGTHILTSLITGCTSYKNRKLGFWTRAEVSYDKLNIWDNFRGYNGIGQSILSNSVLVGESDNIGIPLAPYGRSIPDKTGDYSPQLIGFETYDQGPPQYSMSNVYINFTTNTYRNASAISFFQPGPFILSTSNRFYNNTLINSNPVYIKYGVDCSYGWANLDIDGTVTNVTGGGWMVSSTSLYLNDDCRLVPNWNAHFCPPFAEGYVHLLVDDWTARNMSKWYNGWVAPDGYRLTYATWYQLGNSSRSMSLEGNPLSCSNGAAGCYGYTTDVKARHSYTIRFGNETYPQPTPNYLRLRWRYSSPGDWVVFAFAYPPTAAPFTATLNGTAMTAAASLSALSPNTYYYDAATQHLYLKLVNKVPTYRVVGKLVQYDYPSDIIVVRANCTNCTAPTAIPAEPNLGFVEDQYRATLQLCQVYPATRATTGSGNVFTYFNPDTKLLTMAVYHDITSVATKVELYYGATGVNGTLLQTKVIPTFQSPVRVFFQLSYDQWVALAGGKLYVLVSSTTARTGHLRGQLGCYGNCTLPPGAPIISACSPATPVLRLFNDSIVKPFSDWSIVTGNETVVYGIINPLCGTKMARAILITGTFAIGGAPNSTNITYVDYNTYKALEFFVRAVDNATDVFLKVTLYNKYGVAYKAVVVQPRHISNYLIDGSQFSRVRIPLTDFGISASFYLGKLAIQNATPPKTFVRFYLDEIRFSTNAADNVGTAPLTRAAPFSRIC